MKRPVVAAWLSALMISASIAATHVLLASARSPEGTSDSSAIAGGSVSGGARLAAVPRLVRFSGTVRDVAGKPAVGVTEVTFSLYREEAGGEALWFETQNVEADAQGRFTVLLGAMHADGLPMDLFTSGEARWLGVSVGRLPEQARVLLVAVPYALKAADADTLGGKPATDFVLSGELRNQVHNEVKAQVAQPAAGVSTRTLVGTAPTPQALGETQSSFLCNLAADCVAVTQSGSGNGLHATTPTGSAVLGEFTGTVGAAVYGRATATSGAPSAVQGDAAAPFAVGVLGRAFGTTGTSKGVFGRSFSTSGIGVHGDATTTTGATRGVWGTTVSTGGVGVYGQSSAATGFTTGVSGTVASTSGVAIFAQAYAVSGTTIGVQARASSPAGTAVVADNVAGGKIISGQNNGVEKFSLDGLGNVVASGALTGTRFVSTVATGTAPLTLSSTTAVANLNADLLDGFHAVAFQPAGAYATLAGNTFVGNQSITGNMTLSGSINSGLVVRANATSPSIIEGFSGNTIAAGVLGGTIGGGGVTANANVITDDYGTIGGGYGNQAGNNLGTTSDQTYSTVGGGFANKARGTGSTIGGGAGNIADGFSSTVPGGNSNTATGYLSFAAGSHAQAGHDGSFVWSDNSAVTSTASTGVNQFIVRAAGGVWFGDTGTVSFPASSFLATSTGAYLSTAGVWTNTSDRNLKEQFSSVDGQALLARLAAIPISTWNYKKQDSSIRHMGPMAQDFRAAFGLGEDDKHISTVDADGVSLAAIQALYRKSLEKDEQIRQLTQQVSELQGIRKQMALLQARLARLEKQSGNAGSSRSVASRANVPRSGATMAKVKF